MTLPSNASMKEYPNNVQTDYTTLIKNPIVLNGKYEVALHDISYSSQFSVDLGTITIPNPFYSHGDVYSRAAFIEFKITALNGVSSEKFFQNLNKQIAHKIMYHEYVMRYELAFLSPETNKTLKQIHKDPLGKIIIPAIFTNNVYKVKYVNDARLGLVSEDLKQKIIIANGRFEEHYIVFDTLADLEKLGHVTHITVPDTADDLPHAYVNFYKTHDESDFFNASFDEIKDEYKIKNFYHIVPSFVFFASDALNIVYNNIIACKFNGLFGVLCGKTENFEIKRTLTTSFEHSINVVNQACIYCDFIEDQYFGDVLAPILQVINLKSNEGSSTVTFYENPMYVNVKKTIINSINIRILDTSGHNIKFENLFSFVIVKLHFRKKE
jgi:hypothetical protein